MSSKTSTMPAHGSFQVVSAYRKILSLADRIPFWLVQGAARVAVATVFWNSAQSKLASWQVTQQLFAMEYHVPLLSPEIAAPLATATELTGSVLVFLGLFARFGASALLGVVAVIQLFIFPGNWAEHLLWSSLLLLIVSRGAGKLSLDELASRYFRARS
jgi:putative oxidoreductase